MRFITICMSAILLTAPSGYALRGKDMSEDNSAALRKVDDSPYNRNELLEDMGKNTRKLDDETEEAEVTEETEVEETEDTDVELTFGAVPKSIRIGHVILH